jgi:hypothetical protein
LILKRERKKKGLGVSLIQGRIWVLDHERHRHQIQGYIWECDCGCFLK